MRGSSWLAYLALGLAGTGLYLLVPPFREHPVVFNLIGLSAVVAIVAGVRRHRPSDVRPWALFALALGLFVLGDVVAYNYPALFAAELPFPSVADALYLAMYPALVLGIWILARARSPRRDRAAVLDSLILTAAVGAISWVLLISPYANDRGLSLGHQLISAAYPLMDLLLLGMLVRLAFGSGARSPALRMILLGVVCLFAADGVYGWLVLHTSFSTGGPLDLAWALSYLLMGAAALHPSMATLDRRSGPERTPRPGRLPALVAAVLALPVVQIVLHETGQHRDVTLLQLVSAGMFVLILVRVRLLMVDILEHRRAEARLREAEENLREALEREQTASADLRRIDELKSSILSAVSHELRTPLTSILGMAEILQTHRGRIEAGQADEFVDRIAANSRRLSRLLTDLLDLDRLSRGIVEPNRQPIELLRTVRNVLAQEGLAPTRLSVEVDPLVAELDAAQFERIVVNLVANALRYTPDGTPVALRVVGREDGVLVVVDDAGPGIPEPLKQTIFEPFRQGPAVVKHSPGLGVGLSLVSRFAEQHGGRAWVEDAETGGASFRVFLRSPRVRAIPPVLAAS